MNMQNIDFTKAPRNPPRCAECGKKTALGKSDDCYPDEPFMRGRAMWVCGCGAFGGCEDGTIIPKSRPALPETRALRSLAWKGWRARRDAFPGTWKEKRGAISQLRRGIAVAAKSGRAFEFGWLSREEAQRVVDYLATLP